jgi:hypothetical protein
MLQNHYPEEFKEISLQESTAGSSGERRPAFSPQMHGIQALESINEKIYEEY